MSGGTKDPVSIEIRIDVASQKLHLVVNGSAVKSWPVSTSRSGTGFEVGSHKTPTGAFRIAEKIGHGAQPWSVFKSRRPTGAVASPGGEEDGILTRILWLDGLDPDNANTHGRYIYIHGTNQEHLIGSPASHGCIRMRNADIVELFDIVPENTPVRIA